MNACNSHVSPTLIYLIGARGSGKTTVGRQLAALLNSPFHDLDEILCQSEQKSVADIVSAQGWEKFRELESHYLKKTTTQCAPGAVIATGGGIILSEENRNFMQAHGHVIWLDATVETVQKRLQEHLLAAQRPALTELSMLDEIRQVMAERKHLYENCAHKIVDGNRPAEEICKLIIAGFV